MKKIKFGNRIKALAAIFVISGSIANATPSEEEALESKMQWLIATEQVSPPGICNDYPRCPPPFAPTEFPDEKAKKEKK